MQIDIITSESLPEKKRLQMICRELAKLHATGAPEDLLSKIGVDFLENLFYHGLLISLGTKGVVLTIMDGETVAAFVAVTLDMKRCLRQIVVSHLLRSIRYGFSHVFLRPKLWGPFIEALRLSAPQQSQPTAEILMIAAGDTYRGRRFGVKLLSALDSALQRYGIQTCLARVREDNIHATRMYESCGYSEIGSITFNGSRWKWLKRELPKI